jgi:hypothetical protein
LNLIIYTDADWASCPDTHPSTSGYAVFMSNNLVSWSSKRQNVVSCSSTEAEYHVVATLVYCDNVTDVYLSTNPIQHQRTKHVKIDLHFIRKCVAIGNVHILHVPTTSQFVDIFTKELPSSVFSEFQSSLNIYNG